MVTVDRPVGDQRASREVRIPIVALVMLISPIGAAVEFHIKKEAFRLDITESFLASYHGDLGYLISEREYRDPFAMPPTFDERPERRFVDFINKLNISLQWRRFRLATRFDTAAYVLFPDAKDKPLLDKSCGPYESTPINVRNRFCQNYFYPEKLSLEYVGRSVEATLGDFYVSFGRGIVLSIRKLDELGIDTTIIGGKLVFHEGNAAGTLVAGVSNIQNTDQATGRSAQDPYDVIAGGRVEYRFADRINVGLHTTGGISRTNKSIVAQLRNDGVLHYGGSIDAPRLTRWLSLYFEADGQMTVLADQRSNGYAIYGSATAYAGAVSLLLEVKHYSQLKRWRSSVDGSLPEFLPVAYTQPPTVERLVTELLAPIYDVSGPRLRVDWTVGPKLLLFASYAFFEERAIPGKLYFHDPYLGAEVRWDSGRSHFFPSGGYRVERCGDGPDAADCQSLAIDGDFQRIGHVEWDFTQLLPKRLSIEAQGFALFRQGDKVIDNAGNPASWTEGNAYFALKWTPHLVFTVGYEWSTRPATAINQHYVNGAIQWNITTASSIRVFAGGTRGGLKCISGVCRNFPSFTGAQLELVVRL